MLLFDVTKTHNKIICKKKVQEETNETAGNVIKGTDKIKFLDILKDDRLSFKDHVSGLQKQVSMASGMLNSVSKLIPAQIKLKVKGILYLDYS